MSDRLCNRCLFEELKRKCFKKGQLASLHKVKEKALKGWMQVYIDGKTTEIYYMSVSKDCAC
jgi:hypothetical protein